jgi:Arc/MetJ-type ribon-helix-helix transcriptional regulator
MVKDKILAGEYASESGAIREGLRTVENWLRDQVGPAYDALKANPSSAITPDQVRARLAAEYAKAR